jgi:hypothetical protein
MRFTNKFSRKAAAITVASALTVFGGAGAALAYWTTTGSGSGSAAVAQSNGTLVLSSAPISGVTPGSVTQVPLFVANANSSDLQVGTVTVHISSASGNGFTEAQLNALGVSVTSPAENVTSIHNTGATALPNNAVLTVTNAAFNQDALKGITIDFALTSN